MRRPRDDSSEWLGALYDRYAAGLYRYALMILADREGAADAVHQVFVKLSERSGEKLATEASYLRRAVRNECFTMLRARRWESQEDPRLLLEVMKAVDDKPEERLEIARALRDLPPEQREVVHLRVFEGMTFQEIADLSGESINTIASRYRYALEKMRAALGH